jgi:hypothetical protein
LELISYKSDKSIESRMSASEGTSPAAPVKKGMKPWMIALIAIIIVVIIIAAVVLSGVLTPTGRECA